jgi:hypothetical protein
MPDTASARRGLSALPAIRVVDEAMSILRVTRLASAAARLTPYVRGGAREYVDAIQQARSMTMKGRRQAAGVRPT